MPWRPSLPDDVVPRAVRLRHTGPYRAAVVPEISRLHPVLDRATARAAVQVPSSAGHLLEYRLGQAGHDAAGFAVAVPHYLADASYPAAAVSLLGSVAGISGLSLAMAPLEASALEVRTQVDAQVEGAEEVTAVVRALEVQYDAYLAGAQRSLLAEMGGSLPTAEELGDELERYLAQQTEGDA